MNKLIHTTKTAGFLLLISCICSCHSGDRQPETKASNQEALIDADKAFSGLCRLKGMKNAFIECLDSNGVLLRPNHSPLIGANAIDFLLEQDDSDYSLTWEPHFAEAASSGDLGYTYGIYQLHIKSKDTSIYGSYVSIWKKQQDGKWKFVLDTGNEGISSE